MNKDLPVGQQTLTDQESQLRDIEEYLQRCREMDEALFQGLSEEQLEELLAPPHRQRETRLELARCLRELVRSLIRRQVASPNVVGWAKDALEAALAIWIVRSHLTNSNYGRGAELAEKIAAGAGGIQDKYGNLNPFFDLPKGEQSKITALEDLCFNLVQCLPRIINEPNLPIPKQWVDVLKAWLKDLKKMNSEDGLSYGDPGIGGAPTREVSERKLRRNKLDQENFSVDSAKQPRPKVNMKREDAHPLIARHLSGKPHMTVKEVASVVGCSTGVVGESPAWRVNRKRLKDAKTKNKDPIALPLEDYLAEAGDDSKGGQIHGARLAEEERDNNIDARDQELFKRIGEYKKSHPDADTTAIAKAVGCTAGDVERRQAAIDRLTKEQAADEQVAHMPNKPLGASKP